MILLSIVTYTFTAYYSTGFFHADEHFQIIEFAGLKAGWNTYKDSVWEYHKQIRSSIQPTIAYGIISISKLFRINDPYTLSFILREITGLTLIYSLVLFHRNTQRFINSINYPQYNNLLKLLYLGFLLLIWYTPYLGVRFSSETWSAIFLLLALCFFFSEKSTKRNILITGLFFGLSFLFRFQIAFAIAGFGIYQFFYGSIKLKTTLLLIVGFLFVVMVGVFIDYWFYGNWVFTPLNYLNAFFKHDNTIPTFENLPWNYYLNCMFHLPTKLIGTLLLISLAVAIIFKRKSVMLWIVLSFILVHTLIGHKEERFLFPIIFFFPFFFLQLFQLMLDTIPKKISLTLIILWSFAIVITSIVGLPILATTSAGLGRNGITRFIHENYPEKPVNLIAMPYSNPYAPWFLNERFYLDKNLTFTYINVFEELDSTILKKDTVNLFVTTNFYLNNYPESQNIEKLGFKRILQSVPEIQLKMDHYVRGIDDQNVTFMYELKR